MKATSCVSVTLFTVFCVAACTTRDDGMQRDTSVADLAARDARESKSDLEFVRGHYVFGHEVRALRLCGAQDTLWVDDPTQRLQTLHAELASGNAAYAEIFVAAMGRMGPAPREGPGAAYARSVTIVELIYAAGEGFGCDFDWSRFRYRAQGNEPFWTMEVLPNGMQWTRPGHTDMTWTHVNEGREADAVIFRAEGEDGSRVELVIRAGPSRDSMSGAYYGLSARLTLGDRIFVGSALRGSFSMD